MDPANSAAQTQQVLVLGGLALANLGAIVGSYVSMRIAIAELKIQVAQNTKDINGLAGFVGTPTAMARTKVGEG